MGASFFLETLRIDPLFIGTLCIGIVLGCWVGGRDRWLALGAMFSVLWAVGRGGSLTAGHDLTCAFLIALLLILRRLNTAPPLIAGVAAAAAAALGIAVATQLYRSDSRFGSLARVSSRVHDERADDYQATGLLLDSRTDPAPRSLEVARAREVAAAHERVAVSNKPGMFGVTAGPSVFVLDPHGSVDPLLPRLPPAVGSRRLRDAERRIPDGYLESAAADRSLIRDAPLATLDMEIRLATRATVAMPSRFWLLWHLTRDGSSLIARSSYGPERVSLAEVSNAESPTRSLNEGGLIIALPVRQAVTRIEADVSAKYDYSIELLDGSRVLSRLALTGQLTSAAATVSRVLATDTSVPVTTVWVRCGRGIGSCLVRALRID